MLAASTLFLSGKDNDIVEIIAGVTPMFDEPGVTTKKDQVRFAEWAEENLEKFLEGVVFKWGIFCYSPPPAAQTPLVTSSKRSRHNLAPVPMASV